MNRHTLYYNLHDAFTEEGCPVCRLCSQAVDRYLSHLLYESVNDPGVRQNIRRSQGFCTEHAWQLQQKGDALGIAIIHRDVITNILRTLSRGRGYSSRTRSFSPSWLKRLLFGVLSKRARQWVEALTPTGECPVCRQRTEVEYAYLETLLQHCTDPELLDLWRISDGLCWPHSQHALRLARDEATLHTFIEIESTHFGQLCDELGEFIRRYDYHFGSKGFGSESDSWIRAIGKVSGWPRHHG